MLSKIKKILTEMDSEVLFGAFVCTSMVVAFVLLIVYVPSPRSSISPKRYEQLQQMIKEEPLLKSHVLFENGRITNQCFDRILETYKNWAASRKLDLELRKP